MGKKLQASKLIVRLLVVAAGLSAAAAAVPASELDTLLQRTHPWGRFEQGAWRQVRIVTQSFDEKGQPADTSITDNKTTVVEVTPERVTLQVEVTVEVAGQRFPSQPQIIKQGYSGETLGETTSIKTLDPETVTIDGREIRCETQQVEITGGVTREVSVITFAPDHDPAVLRRKSTVSDSAGAKTMQEVTSEVKSLRMARRVLGEPEPRSAFLVRLEQKNDRGTTVTWSWHVPQVPGEVVDECTQKLDDSGRLVRRTTLELVGYGRSQIDEMETRGVFREPDRRSRREKRRGR